MSEWALKRFWEKTDVAEADGGFTVTLDGRSVRTPAKALLALPTVTLAEAVAAEWAAQQEQVDPQKMPVTRMANSAIDKVTPQHGEVARLLADYGDSDLLCYRADAPEGLVARQTAAWDPYLDWAAEALGARLVPLAGVMHTPQNPNALARLHDLTAALPPFELAAFHDLVSLTGSLILGFAAADDATAAERIWDVSRVDELWQIEQWGEDEEAEKTAMLKKTAFLEASTFLQAARRT